ncbi:phosphotransferase [Actinophytocola xanthii]|uniref:Aminoglycoside phosphotransferase domain-containing protein n=1 Tax=Actinophytocola xanthii TaxID=1912961 RepID=A0A1Q8CLB2_9PSEU|nr:phosphotransferase [Actinophytocola xanthii]OLF15142.1 hypothetical protein BU204_23000 [Actinophytocola xanthii]
MTPEPTGIATWSTPEWMAGAVSWMDTELAAAGLRRTGPVTQPHLRAWSTVLTAPTGQGPVWLKAPGPRAVFEVPLYELLGRVVPDRVLTPIAVDLDRGWLLLPDGGPTLHAAGAGDAELAEMLPRYGQLQRDLAGEVDALLAIGLTDMRASAMPARFEEALEVARRLTADEEDRAAVEAVAALRPEFTEWCHRLAASPVPSSLDHNDLHTANIFADGTRFYDWGDAVVAHSFASMLVALNFAADVPRLRDAYLEPFTDLAPRAELVAEVELACRVSKAARALVWERALAADPTGFERAPLLTLLAVGDPSWLTLGA